MRGSEIDNFWKPEGGYPVRPLVGGAKTRDNQVPDFFFSKDGIVCL